MISLNGAWSMNHKGFWALMDFTELRQKISSYNTHVLKE